MHGPFYAKCNIVNKEKVSRRECRYHGTSLGDEYDCSSQDANDMIVV